MAARLSYAMDQALAVTSTPTSAALPKARGRTISSFVLLDESKSLSAGIWKLRAWTWLFISLIMSSFYKSG